VLDSREAFALVSGELDVDLGRRDDPDFGELDDGDGLVVVVVEREPLADAGNRLSLFLVFGEQSRRRCLFPGEHAGHELPPQLGAGMAEPQRRQLCHDATTPCDTLSLGGVGARSTWRWYQSVKASRPQS